jgi:hypothetical protein
MNDRVLNLLKNIPESKDLIEGGEAPFNPVRQSYARLETITRSNGKVYGCWADTFTAACSETRLSEIEGGAVLDYQAAGTCADGKVIHAITWF